MRSWALPSSATTRPRLALAASSRPRPEGLAPGAIDALVRERLARGEDLYHLDGGALADIGPDLIVTQDLCAVCAIDVSEVEDALIHLGCQARVLTLDPMRLDEVIASVGTVGAATGRDAAAADLMSSLRARLGNLAARLDGARSRPVLVLEWTDPPFSAGHWVPDMVAAAGGAEVLGRAGERSEAVTWARVHASGPEVVIVAPVRLSARWRVRPCRGTRGRRRRAAGRRGLGR